MTNLAHLFDAILDNILSYPGASDQLISLYLCGNSMLNTRICRCVSVFRMDDAPECRKMFRIPRLLYSLSKLRELVIYSQKWKDPPTEVTESLKKLPPTIKKLHISNSLSVLFCNKFEAGKGRTREMLKAIRDADGNMFIDLKVYFPILEDLKVHFFGYIGHEIMLEPHDWRVFPPTLTSLDWHALKVPKRADISLMPSQLKSIRINFTQIRPEIFCNLPTTIECIGGLLPTDSSFIAMLPHHITSLEYTLFKFSKIAASLPPLLTSLHLSNGDVQSLDFTTKVVNMMSALPRTLTFLHLESASLLLNDIHHLPPLLTTIENFGLGHGVLEECAVLLEQKSNEKSSSFTPSSVWPPNLHTLRLSASVNSLRCLRGLPSTLTVFQANTTIPIDQLTEAVLPPLLTNLSLSCADDSRGNQLTQEGHSPTLFASSLPRLTTLKITSSNFPPHMIEALPSSLIKVELSFVPKGIPLDFVTPSLPPRLQSCYFMHCHPSIFYVLPPTLTSAKLLNVDGHLQLEHLKALPTSLTQLEIQLLFVAGQDWSHLSRLPKSVTSFTLHNYVNAEVLLHLNPRLTHLRLWLNWTPISSDLIEKLHSRWLFWLARYLLLVGSSNTSVDQELVRRNWDSTNPY